MTINKNHICKTIVSLFCVVVLLVNACWSPSFAETGTEAEAGATDTSITEFTLEEWGIADGKGKGTNSSLQSGLTDNLKNIAVEGIFHFPGVKEGNIIFFGGSRNWRGFRILDKGVQGLNFSFRPEGDAGTELTTNTDLFTFTATDLNGKNPSGNDVKIKLSFKVLSEGITEIGQLPYSRVEFSVTIDDTCTKTAVLEKVGADFLKNTMWVYSTTSATQPVTYASPESSRTYQPMTFVELGWVNGTHSSKIDEHRVGSGRSLDGMAVEGICNFGTPTADTSVVYFGGTDTWEGLGIGPRSLSNHSLKVEYINQKSGGAISIDNEVTAEELGVASTVETDLKIRVTFDVLDENDEIPTSDVLIGIYIGERYAKYALLKDANKAVFTTAMSIYAKSGASLTVQSIDYGTYEPITLVDLGCPDGSQDRTDTSYWQKTYTGGSGTLEAKAISGIYNFPTNKYTEIHFGTNSQGFYLRGNADKGLDVCYAPYSGTPVLGTFSAGELKTDSLTGKDLQVELRFAFSNVSEDGTTADVRVTVCVADTLEKQFFKTGVSIEEKLKQVVYMYVHDGTKFDWKSCIEIPSHLLEVVPADYGVTDGKYTQSSGDVIKMGTLQNANSNVTDKLTMLDKVYAATLTFHDASVQLDIGGIGSAHKGIYLKKKDDSNFTLGSTSSGIEGATKLATQTLSARTAGLTSANDTFDFKLSMERIDRDGIGGKNDIRYGVWFGGKLYNNTYFYSLNDASYFGDCMGIVDYDKSQSSLTIESPERTISTELTPYLLEEFGVRDQAVTSHSQTIAMDLEGSSITGKLSMTGNATASFYGQPAQGFKTDGTEFAFTVTEEMLDVDADGSSDDVRMGYWIDGSLYNGKYFYLLDYASDIKGSVDLQAKTGSLTVMDCAKVELYNLANATDETGYLLYGNGELTVNGENMDNGSLLSEPGDYLIRCLGEGSYVKRVSIYSSGDSHVDGIIDILDLIATKKASRQMSLATKAGEEGADSNRDNIVNEKDLDSIRGHLLSEQVITPTKDSYITFQEDIMPIMGYYGPYDFANVTDHKGNTQSYNFITDKIFKLISQAGINGINKTSHRYGENNEAVLKGLALAEKYGINVFVDDHRIGEETTQSMLANYLSEYAQYSSFKGSYVEDEPSKDAMINKYTNHSKLLNRYSNTLGYINLHPQPNVTDYTTYVDTCLEYCNPKVLSWDFYVWDTLRTDGQATYASIPRYFKNLSFMREKAINKEIPFWTYIQAGTNWVNSTTREPIVSSNEAPNQAQLLWNVNTSLAYGAKGIQYFPLVQPYYFAYENSEDGYDYARNGLIGANGEPTIWYNYAKYANAWVAKVDEVMLHATSVDVLVQGDETTGIYEDTGVSQGLGEESILSSITAAKGAVVGVFDYQGKRLYYVVNYDRTASQEVELMFNGKQDYSVMSQEDDYNASGSACKLSIEAGGAAIVIVN